MKVSIESGVDPLSIGPSVPTDSPSGKVSPSAPDAAAEEVKEVDRRQNLDDDKGTSVDVLA